MMQKLALLSAVFFASAGMIQAQPQTPLTGTNTACATGPSPSDTAGIALDSGFVKIFNGKNLKGWWEGCGSTHSANDKVNGGIWLVDSNTGVLFSNQNTNGAGSVLMTNKSYGNYELILDLWPSFGNDGGVFNRVTASGTCYQTTMDYVQGSSVGGVYFEGGYSNVTRNVDPFVFGANKATVTIGTNSNVNNRLDSITKRFGNPLEYGCPATGCGPANWTAVWDTGGWNQMRVLFYGTGASATNKVHNFAWIRKAGSTKWIPTVRDSVQTNTPAAPLGLQIHGGTSSWSNRNGNWYRNIKIRPLSDDGTVLYQGVAISGGAVRPAADYGLRAVAGMLTGNLKSNAEIIVRDAGGRALESFSHPAGAFSHVLKSESTGMLIVQIRTAQGADYVRLPRVFE